jgi:tripartite-type tricarboxylate transporter receptor subunit TctC
MRIMDRRAFLKAMAGAGALSAAGAMALPARSRVAWAQSYPTRPVRFIVGFAAGGPNDMIARLLGQWLSDRLGQQFVVENRTGAGGNIGAEAAAKAIPDGYTFLVMGASNAINPSLYAKLNFDPVRDLVPVAGVLRNPNVLVINPAVPAKTVPEFIAYAKANPGKITMASAGIGSNQHLSGEFFKMLAGVNLVHVPYRGGGPALIDLIGGQVQMMIDPIPSSIEYIRAGKLRALATTGAERSELLPDLPTISESVPGYEASGFTGISAPKNTSPEIIERLNREINSAFENPTIKARFADWGATPLPGSPTDFGTFFAQEIDKWGKVVKFSGARAE